MHEGKKQTLKIIISLEAWCVLFYSVICGLTEETKPGHIVKGALEAVTFQVRDVLHAMALDCGYPLQNLLVDGGMTVNRLLMQMQADYCGIPVGNIIANVFSSKEF